MPKRSSLFLFLATAAIGMAQPIMAQTASTVTATSWVYYNGVFEWPVDYSFAASPDYVDASGEPRSGAHDVKVQITSAWGGWSPVAPNSSFNSAAFNNLTVSLKPTIANQKWHIYFQNSSGTAAASDCAVNVTDFGPAPTVGQWATYTIPLSDLCVSGASPISKFVVQDATGLSDNSWFVDNVGFESVSAVTTGPVDPAPAPVTTPLNPAVTTQLTAAVAAPAGSSGTSWVYYNGAMVWPGDYSWSVSVNYNDSGGKPLSGAHDIKVSLKGPYGGWQPYAKNKSWSTRGYNKLTFALKPTQDNQRWNLYFVAQGDRSVGNNCTVNVRDYGPTPVVGKWATYSVPLSKLCVANTSIYKFAIHDETGSSNNSWYVDNVGFTP